MSSEPPSNSPEKQPMDHYNEASTVNHWIGRALMLIAALLACLFFVDYTSETALPLPAFWYKTQPFFFLVAIVSFMASWVLMKPEPTSSGKTTPKPVFDSINFYTRRDCPLCEEAYLTLSQYPSVLPTIKVINIDNDPELVEKFTTCVPVVEIDGKVRFRGKVNEVLFQRLIDAALQTQEEQTDS